MLISGYDFVEAIKRLSFNNLKIEVGEPPSIESKYVFISNSLLKELNQLANEQRQIIRIEDIRIEPKSGIPIFDFKADFKIDIELLISFDMLFLAASISE